ncbi:cytidine deaminase [Streptomyces sulfonofaciens]|uniref:Cytidine deaminase n=1 Tax=Streptomyces sulfonofaciens TaxID=68272 RepID=A0A919G514_9ACTN|nr:cytidine deaminase [Streptomyces sulfonofaciens]GHH77719.1 cytidine deaminase [Streptomyces sulfonofaciens]
MTQGGDREARDTAHGGRDAREPGTAPAGGPDAAEADWPALRAAARDAMSHAYAPYSGFPVGAAARVDDGRTVSGCNVENASYGLGLCAECGLVSELLRTGGGTLTHFTCVNRDAEILMPCGRCRQLLYEFGGPALVLETPTGFRTLGELLPEAFGPDQLR